MKATKAMKRAVWADPITAKARIAELEAELEFMSTIQEANDVEITALMEDNVKLEQQLAELREENKSLEYQLWSLCDSEGIEWYGDIPTDPDAPIKQESSDGDI